MLSDPTWLSSNHLGVFVAQVTSSQEIGPL